MLFNGRRVQSSGVDKFMGAHPIYKDAPLLIFDLSQGFFNPPLRPQHLKFLEPKALPARLTGCATPFICFRMDSRRRVGNHSRGVSRRVEKFLVESEKI